MREMGVILPEEEHEKKKDDAGMGEPYQFSDLANNPQESPLQG